MVLAPGLIHATCHYHGQWIPGDQRGFRSRDHRIHSSGDYRNPPPIQEHAGLRQWVRVNMNQPPVTLEPPQFEIVGLVLVHKLQRMNCEVVVLSSGPTHVHTLFVPSETDVIKQLGKAKQFASLKCPNHAGQLWAESCDAVAVQKEQHACNAYQYICDHAVKEGAWVWRADRDAKVSKAMIAELLRARSGSSSLSVVRPGVIARAGIQQGP